MQQAKLRIFAPNVITVCVDGRSNTDFYGRIWNQYSNVSFRFSTMMDLIFRMEELYDYWDFPQRSTNCRSFNDEYFEEKKLKKHKVREEKRTNVHNIQEKRGKSGTFIVQVQYRQNSTWQGQVIWAEENRREHFRSALELMKLIDGALSEKKEGKESAS